MIDNLQPELLKLQLDTIHEKTICEHSKTSTSIAQRLAQNPTTAPEVLRKLSESSDFTTRFHAPLDTLNTLAKDANRIVRAAARANIQRRK